LQFGLAITFAIGTAIGMLDHNGALALTSVAKARNI